ncbi:MAG: hypothetical protein JW819_02205 [Candidatus Krumholzibacteriota bacterium]|nr:hypothetical protein [Candidatus Krumholzibacteriota bacterium]
MIAIRSALAAYLIPLASARALRIAVGIAAVALGGLAICRTMGWLDAGALAVAQGALLVPGLPLLAAIVAEIPLRDGITQRTLLYPLLGPVSRPLLAAVRTLATGVLLFALVTALILVFKILGPLGWSDLPRLLTAALLGSLTYTAIFGLLQLAARRGLILSLVVYFMLDGPIGQLPFRLRNVAPSFHLRALSYRIDFIDMPLGWDLPADPPLLSAALVLIGVTAACTALTAWLFARKRLVTLC